MFKRDPPKMGIEIEYLIMTRDGKSVESGWKSSDQNILGLKILKKAAQLLEPGIRRQADPYGHKNVYNFKDGKKLLPDTFTLLETVTTASNNLNQLRDQLWEMKNALIKAAAEFDCLVLGAASPVGYSNDSLTSTANTSCNHAGMHIHINAPTDRVKTKLANLLIQIIPELTAISTNSPIYNKSIWTSHSARLEASPLVGAKTVEVLFYDPDTPIRFDDGTKRYRFVTAWTKSKQTVEIRGFDTPIDIDWAMAIAALMQCLAEKATILFIDENYRRNTIMSNRKKLRQDNYEAALEKGMGAQFKPDRTTHINLKEKNKQQYVPFLYHNKYVGSKKKVAAELAVKRLLYYVEAEAYKLGLTQFLEPIYNALKTKKNQSDLQLQWFNEHGYKVYLKKLTEASARKPVNSEIKVIGGNHYFTVRQRQKDTLKDLIYLTANSMDKMGIKSGDKVHISGPMASFELKVGAETVSPRTIPLADNEVRVGRRFRNFLGLAIYDPVIIGLSKASPIVIRKTGEDWAFTAEGPRKLSDKQFKVRKGLKEHPDSVVVNNQDAFILGLRAGYQIKVATINGQTGDFSFVESSVLRRGTIAMMAKARKSLSVSLGDIVQLSIIHREKIDKKELVVVPGDRKDIGKSPPVIRLKNSIMESLQISDGESLWVQLPSQSGNELKPVAVKKATGKKAKNAVGIVKAARDEFNVKVGESITILKNKDK